MKNMKIINKIIVLMFMLVMFLNIDVFAANGEETDAEESSSGISISGIIEDMDPSKVDVDPTKGSRLLKIVSQAFTVIQFVGTGISIIMVMWLGITYMLTSVEQKAEIKKRMVPIVIGSVLIVSTVNILKLIQVIIANSIPEVSEET
ncbi:MAG: hypothetical protein J6J60_06760 [Clostridia bacterium]|nr:hypothetical protein [Clostridia bacterium]